MDIGKRIEEVRGSINRDSFSTSLGVTRNTIQRYEKYGRKPNSDFIEAICNKYKIHADWLIFGTPPKFKKDALVQPLDTGILTDAIAGLEEALTAKGRVMTPEEKAEIIKEIYLFIAEQEKSGTKSNIATILKLIA